MAEYVREGVESEGVTAKVSPVSEVHPSDLLEPEGIIIGSPTYYGGMAAEIKSLLDQSVRYHGKLVGKVGGAFSSAANVGGGNETTVRSILDALLIHGMVIQGLVKGDHYGPVAVGAPDERAATRRSFCAEAHGPCDSHMRPSIDQGISGGDANGTN